MDAPHWKPTQDTPEDQLLYRLLIYEDRKEAIAIFTSEGARTLLKVIKHRCPEVYADLEKAMS